MIPSPGKGKPLIRYLTPLLLFLGVSLRLREYFSDRSMWLDESALAINILRRTFGGFLRPLDFGQRAPLGFLAAERTMVTLFGSSERAMRLVPLAASLLSLVLFYFLGRRYLTRIGLTISLALFVLCGPVVYYAAEVKQYSTDVAVTLFLFALASRPLEEGLSIRRTVLLAAAGAVAIWWSDPAVFVLAGIGTTFLVGFSRRRDLRSARRAAAMGFVWSTSFAGLWFAMLRDAAVNPGLLAWWREQQGFMPLLPRSLADVVWFPQHAFSLFALPVRVAGGFGASAFAGLAMLAFFTGIACGSMPKAIRWMLLSPIPFALLASSMEKYPFSDRLLLFLIPSILFVMGDGASSGFRAPDGRRRRADRAFAILRTALVALLVAFCAWSVARPQIHHEVRPVLEYVKRRGGAGDLIYGYGGHRSRAVVYYLSRMGFNAARYVEGVERSENQANYSADLERLRGHRAWIVFSLLDGDYQNEDRVLLFRLQTMGPRLDAVRKPGAAAYLYDLRNAGPAVAVNGF